MKHFKTEEDVVYFLGILAGIGIVVGLIVYFMIYIPAIHPSVTCSYYAKTGFYCFGCGGTRACRALLKGQILRSIYFHPLVMYFIVMYTSFMGTQTLERIHIPKVKGLKFHPWYIYLGLILFVGNWILKNILLIVFHMRMPLA